MLVFSGKISDSVFSGSSHSQPSTDKFNYQAQYVQLNKTNEKLETDIKALFSQHKELQQQYGTLKIDHEKIKKDHKDLSAAHQQQSMNLEKKHHSIIELQLKLKMDSEKITALDNELSKANDKINSLRHDHQFTSQEKANLEGQVKQLRSILSSKNAVIS